MSDKYKIFYCHQTSGGQWALPSLLTTKSKTVVLVIQECLGKSSIDSLSLRKVSNLSLSASSNRAPMPQTKENTYSRWRCSGLNLSQHDLHGSEILKTNKERIVKYSRTLKIRPKSDRVLNSFSHTIRQNWAYFLIRSLL